MVSRAEFTLGQLAEALGATLEGDPARVVRGVAPLESAGPDDVSFLTDARYRAAAQASKRARASDRARASARSRTWAPTWRSARAACWART